MDANLLHDILIHIYKAEVGSILIWVPDREKTKRKIPGTKTRHNTMRPSHLVYNMCITFKFQILQERFVRIGSAAPLVLAVFVDYFRVLYTHYTNCLKMRKITYVCSVYICLCVHHLKPKVCSFQTKFKHRRKKREEINSYTYTVKYTDACATYTANTWLYGHGNFTQ